jgi:hypothetical protein
MKRIVNGVTYNTDTSTRLAQSRWEPEAGESVLGTLHQTRGGAFFVDQEITKMVWNEDERRHEERVVHEFVPLSPQGAHDWLMDGEVEVFQNPFEDPPEARAEAEPGETIYIRVPASLKRSVEEAAKNEKVSGNVWAMRCVERCLNPDPYPDAKEAIATAYSLVAHVHVNIRDRNVNLPSHQRQSLIGLLNEAEEQIQEAWGSLDFDDESQLDAGAQMIDLRNKSEFDRLITEYPISKDPDALSAEVQAALNDAGSGERN